MPMAVPDHADSDQRHTTIVVVNLLNDF